MFVNNFSIILPIVFSRDIGLYLDTDDGSSFLNKGDTFASFQISGNIPLDME